MRILSSVLLCLATLGALTSAVPQKAIVTSDKSLVRAGLPQVQARFDGQQVVSLKTPGQKVIPDEVRKQINALELDIWDEGTSQLHIRVDAEDKAALSKIPGVELTPIVEDLQALVESEKDMNENSLVNDWFGQYHNLEDIYSWYNQLASDNPTLVSSPVTIGTTIENRAILQLRVTAPGDATNRKRVWIEGLMHAREWISGATVQYLAHSLVKGYNDNDARVKALLEKVVFVFIPAINPDGYAYSWSNNRLWRKNREHIQWGRTYGVDLNRNWPDHWGGVGSSSNPSAEDFRGPSAASSREVQALMAAYLKEPHVVGAIDFHSYSQLVLRPYGWTRNNSPDEPALKRVGDQFAADIRATTGKSYTSQRSIELYATTGDVVDWWYGSAVTEKKKAGVPSPRPYAYCVELRPASAFGGQGFILPPSEIIPTGREIFAATLHFAEYVSANPLPDA